MSKLLCKWFGHKGSESLFKDDEIRHFYYPCTRCGCLVSEYRESI